MMYVIGALIAVIVALLLYAVAITSVASAMFAGLVKGFGGPDINKKRKK